MINIFHYMCHVKSLENNVEAMFDSGLVPVDAIQQNKSSLKE